MDDRLRCAVVTTRDRPDDFADCIRSLRSQVHYIAIVAHMDPDYVWEHRPHNVVSSIVPYREDPPNISKMWNLGLECAKSYADSEGERYDVAVLNDDVVLPFDWFYRVTTAMHKDRRPAAAGCVARSFDWRMTGYAFILNGDRNLRADEQFQWWYGDTDLEARARLDGGVAFAPGVDVEHRHPNSTTVGVLAEIAEQDKVRYKRKWGRYAC